MSFTSWVPHFFPEKKHSFTYLHDSVNFNHLVLIKKENEVCGKKELIFINWTFCATALLKGLL